MSNWDVTDKRIYQLLKHLYQVDKSVVEEMTSAYLDFVEKLLAYFLCELFELCKPQTNSDIISQSKPSNCRVFAPSKMGNGIETECLHFNV